jgi:predicted nucleic acid-binding protein
MKWSSDRIFNAAYLELAMRRGLPLATLDQKLLAASKRSGEKNESTGFWRSRSGLQ